MASRFPNLLAFAYGTEQDAFIYTYDPSTQSLTVHLAVLDGHIVPDD
jgi:hypothetical protein